MKISAGIITKNEENNIERCLSSVKFCDEIVIIDDFSTDKTVEMAKKLGASIIQRKLDGNFANQRNFCLEQCSGEWIIFLDADEEITSELKEEILKKVKDKEIGAYYIKRRDKWWGRWLRFGELMAVYNSGLLRLVKKNSGKWKGQVHEEFKTSKLTGKLNSFLNHYPHQDIKSFIKKINYYSSLRAKELYESKIKSSIFQIIFYPSLKFFLNYFILLGFIDGAPGFTYAFLMSFHSFLVRAKLYQYWHPQKQEYVS